MLIPTLLSNSLASFLSPRLRDIPEAWFSPVRYSADVSFCLLQAFLENEDLGNSLGAVETLLQKHDDFEEAFTAQEEKITVRNGPWFGYWLRVYYIS